MDINLPGISGYEATRRLQERPETRDIPVIALTVAAVPRDAKRGATSPPARSGLRGRRRGEVARGNAAATPGPALGEGRAGREEPTHRRGAASASLMSGGRRGRGRTARGAGRTGARGRGC